MSDYISVKTLIENCNEALKVLVGKTPTKEVGGISKMVADVLEPVLDNAHSLLEVDMCRLKMYCSSLDREIEFADVKPTYKADKRRWDGVGSRLESLELVLTRDIPEDLSVIDLSQQLSYDIAKENFDRLYNEELELLRQFKENCEGMAKLRDIMQSEAYSKEKSVEADKAWGILRELEGHI